jgi:hypothetical protein
MLRNLLPYIGITNGNPGDNAKAAWSQLMLGLMARLGMGLLFTAIAIINVIWLFKEPNWIAPLVLLISMAFIASAVRNVRSDLTTFKQNVDLPDIPPLSIYEKLAWDETSFVVIQRDGKKETMRWDDIARITFCIEEIDDLYGYFLYRYWSIKGSNERIEFSAEAKGNRDFVLQLKEHIASFKINALHELEKDNEEKYVTLWIKEV